MKDVEKGPASASEDRIDSKGTTPERKAYAPPSLKPLGDIVGITHGAAGVGGDGAFS